MLGSHNILAKPLLLSLLIPALVTTPPSATCQEDPEITTESEDDDLEGLGFSDEEMDLLNKALGLDTEGEEDPMLADLTTELEVDIIEPASQWDQVWNLRLGVGYRDNILLSEISPQESPFWATGLDWMLYRLPSERHEFYSYVVIDDYRYLDSDLVDYEQTAFLTNEWKYHWSDKWTQVSRLGYFYQDQVVDVSTTELTGQTFQLQGHGIPLFLGMNYALSQEWELQFGAALSRQYLSHPLDDYSELGPELALVWNPSKEQAWKLQYTLDYRIYDTRTQLTPDGFAVSGTDLHMKINELELEWKKYFGTNREWRSRLRAEYRWTEDNGSGFQDYDAYRFRGDIRYEKGDWEYRADLNWGYYDYLVQRVDFDLNNKSRRRTQWGGSVKIAWEFWDRKKWYAQWLYDTTASTQRDNEFDANTWMTGVDWEF